MQDEETELELPFTDEELQVGLFLLYQHCVYVVGTRTVLFGRVADLHRFNADPDPAFHLNEVPDPKFHFCVDLLLDPVRICDQKATELPG